MNGHSHEPSASYAIRYSRFAIRHFPLLFAIFLALGSLLNARAADNLGVYLARTEHSPTNVATETLVQKGGIAAVRLPLQSVSVSFWLKWDRGADNNSEDKPTDRGNNPVFSFRQEYHETAWGTMKRDEVLPTDEHWHYHLITFQKSGSTIIATHYLDGIQNAPVVRNGSGITNDFVFGIGAEIGLGGTDEGDKRWRSTDLNLILDDLTVWSSTDQEVLNQFSVVADFGMERFDRAHPGILHYYDCDNFKSTPQISTGNRVLIAGNSPSTSWYAQIEDADFTLQDASEPRQRKIQVNVTTAYGVNSITPPPGLTIYPYDGTSQSFIEFSAPEYVYLDRYGNELGSSDSPDLQDWLDQAFYRAHNVGYAIRLGGRSDVTGTARSFAQPTTDDLDISWKWGLEYAVIIESSTAQYEDGGLNDALGNPALSEDGKSVPMAFGRNWVKAGTTVRGSIDGIIYGDGDTAQQNVSYRSTGYFVDNAPVPAGATDRFVVLSGGSDHLRSDPATARFGTNRSFAIEFWARRDAADNGTASAILALDSLWVGFDSDDNLRFGTANPNVTTTVANADLGQEWHHWTYQYDEVTRLMSIQIDGKPIYSANTSPTNWNFSQMHTVLIGAMLDSAGNTSNHFAGSVNNVRLWNKALTSADITAASQSSDLVSGQSNLVLELTMDQVMGDFGLAAAFLDDNDSLALPTAITLPTSYTLEALILLPFPVTPSPVSRAPFFASDNNFGNLGSPIFFEANGDLTSVGGTNESPSGFNINSLAPGWHRFTAVVSGNTIVHHVDGRRVGSSSVAISRRLSYVGSSGTQTQCGWVDDIRIWGTARSSAEISNDWYCPLSLPRTNLLAYFPFDDGTARDAAGNGNDGHFAGGAGTQTPPGGSGTAIYSQEGAGYRFILHDFEALFPPGLPPERIWATLFPTYSKNNRSPSSRINTEAFVIQDWLRLDWSWQRAFRLEIDVSDNVFAPLPFIITEHATYAGLDSMGNVWVPEFSAVTIGTQYRTDDRCSTLDSNNGVSGQLDAFRPITIQTLVDGSFNGKVTRQFSFDAISGPGKLLFTYTPTIHRAEVAIGTGFDVSSLAVVAAQLTPDLCGSQPRLAPGKAGGPSQVLAPNLPEAAIGSGNPWVWDGLANKFYPLVPGTFSLTWPDAVLPGTTYAIEITSAFPTDTITIANRENEDGSRQNPPSYETNVTFPSVSETYPASPAAHYSYVFSTDAGQTPPVALDPSEADRWLFQRTAFAENTSLLTDTIAKRFSSTSEGRAVLLFSYRTNSVEVANGDLTREFLLPLVVSCEPFVAQTQPESQLSLINGNRRALWIAETNQLYVAPQAIGGYFAIGSDRPWTWESWVRLADPASSSLDRILFQIEVRSVTDILQVGVRGSSRTNNAGGLFLSRQPTGGGVETFTFELPEVELDLDWHHWAVTFDIAALRVYRDGVIVAQNAGNPFPYSYSQITNQGGSDQQFHHAYGYSPQEAGSWLNGGFDNLRYWGKALSAEEVRKAMRAQLPTNLVANFSYTFDQGFSGTHILKDQDRTYPASGDLLVISTTGSATPNPNVILVDDASDTYPEVATRIRSRLDTAGFGSGYLVNDTSNYNPHLHNRTAEIGQWGPVYPVNWAGLFQRADRALHVVYYENPYRALPESDGILHPDVAWPYVVVQYDNVTYPVQGVHKDKRIYIASRLGTEGVDARGTDQLVFDPATYAHLLIYAQPDASQAGYNPNEEHALIAPSIKAQLVGDASFNLGQDAAFALQNGLNRTNRNDPGSYTSEPWVLVEYDNQRTGETEMAAYRVEATRTGSALFPALDPETHLPNDPLGKPVSQLENPTYDFNYPAFAGDLVNAPYPLNLVVGNNVMTNDAGADSHSSPAGIYQRTLWQDKNDIPWVVSGNSGFVYRFWYPFRDDFWAEVSEGAVPNTGDPVAWLPDNGQFLATQSPVPQPRTVVFKTYWRTDYPILKRGETMTYPGGENRADHSLAQGLPGIVGWQSARLVFDSRTPTMIFKTLAEIEDYSARVIRPLDQYTYPIGQEVLSSIRDAQGTPLTPASRNRVQVVGERWYFKELTGSLQKRFYFDSLTDELVFRGRLNNREIGASDLTTAPNGLYILEPNILSTEDYEDLVAVGNGNSEWEEAVERLYLASQNPEDVLASGTNPASVEEPVYLSGITNGSAEQVTAAFTNGIWRLATNSLPHAYIPLDSLGTGAALAPNPTLLSDTNTSGLYVTLVENNHELASGAVTLHVVQIGEERFRGAIQIVEAQDLFDEKINLRHTADFGGNTREAYYQWWVRDITSLDDLLLPGQDSAWQLYQQGLGLNQIEFLGRPDVMLADKLFYVRYGSRDELEAISGNDTSAGTVNANSWRLVDPNDPTDDYSRAHGGPVPYQWAGAANSPQLQADGSKRFLPQLLMGWVKRVLDRINPYEARFSETFSGDSPATFSSMIQETGRPFNGPVALNSDKDSLEGVGLIELYETVLARARSLTLDVPGASTAGTHQALLLAATRLSVLYEILASEAYADAQNSALPVSEDDLATANPHVHAFQEQVASLLEEELALLRGTDFEKAYPTYNRLFWNYVKGLGEAAYNLNYDISDANQDGLIDESDAAELYPQGHGDAWGHYLSAARMHYELLRSTAFDWEALPELYSLLGNVIPADFLDERTFSRIAAARARAGVEIVRATYRAAYSADPDGQWQGYTDAADPTRAWGVSEWSRRAGQGALFDWVVGNALVPAKADDDAEDLDRIDRIANRLELGETAAALAQIQSNLDQANSGTNPLGLSNDALSFGLDPFYNGVNWERRTHFEQAYDSAVVAAQNALTALSHASQAEFQLRRTAGDARDLKNEAIAQDLDYRERLIAIYGAPYQGTIGPGKIYDEGYSGPDTLLYMYVDRTDLEDLTPTADPRFTTINAGLESLSKQWSLLDSDLGPKLLAGRSQPEKVRQLFDEFYVTRPWEELELGSADESTDGVLLTIEAPVIETSSYAFRAPDDWGARPATGEIQILLNQMLAAEHERDLAAEDYGEYVKDIAIQHRRLVLQLRRLKSSAAVRDIAQDSLASLEAAGLLLELLEGQFEDASTEAWRQADVFATAFPYISGPFANDFFAQARSAVKASGFLASAASEHAESAVAALSFANKQSKAAIEKLAETDAERIAEYGELLELISEFGAELNNEGHVRRNIASALQQMELLAQQLRSLEAEGLRLQNERAAFNMVLAGKAQRNRYQDMVTRLTRRDALGQYQNAFDNALRFVWLAARAYDYETSLSTGDPAAATTFLEQIVRTRQLGSWTDGTPQIGNGGLAEILAQLTANFQALRGQLGINSPQQETGELSLRTEHFRIRPDSSSDQRWQQALLGARVDDLWQVPEFVHFCRPFAAREQGPQPGLLLEFATAIQPGENVFGRPLAGGDNAYSAANFATKISAVGAWFEGYDSTQLSGAPRVYLVPAGSDVLRIANSPEPELRTWNVVEQRIPVPFLINRDHLADPNFIPSIDSLNGSFAPIRRFGDFRAYYANNGLGLDIQDISTDGRLFGRSAWNTRWLLIIPGATLGAEPSAALDAFINSVTDIKLLLETYSNPGI